MTLTTAQLKEWAKQIKAHITIEGEAQVFESEFEGFGAEVAYTCEVASEAGDYWTAPSWWVKSERVEVVALWNEEGEDIPELLASLNVALA